MCLALLSSHWSASKHSNCKTRCQYMQSHIWKVLLKENNWMICVLIMCRLKYLKKANDPHICYCTPESISHNYRRRISWKSELKSHFRQVYFLGKGFVWKSEIKSWGSQAAKSGARGGIIGIPPPPHNNSSSYFTFFLKTATIALHIYF